MCFHLALTYGLADDPVAALTRMIGRVEQARHDHKVAEPFRATMCASDGTPDNLPIDSHLVVSEPLELHWSERTWHEIPAGTIGIVTPDAEREMTPIQL